MPTVIRTTHTGSLPRPPELLRLNHGTSNDQLATAIADVVRRQLDAGICIVNDGEFPRASYVTYVADRLEGFRGREEEIAVRDLAEFPDYRTSLEAHPKASAVRPSCSAAIRYIGHQALSEEIELMMSAARLHAADEVFMTAASPGTIALFFGNEHYDDYASYVSAISAAMREEYLAIFKAGFTLQLDCPDLAMGAHVRRPSACMDFNEMSDLHVEAMNEALKSIPEDRIRMHICWGNYPGPHHLDIPLASLVSVVRRARPQYIVLEGANPRHAHEWQIFEEHKFPGKIIVPGVIDTTTSFIEHPDLVAERVTRYAKLLGAERVIAGTDCGFSSFAGTPSVDPQIAWKKLEALSEGTKRASARL